MDHEAASAAHEAVGELVEHDASEDHHQPGQGVGDARALRRRAGQDEEGHQHEEAGVHADLDPCDPRDRERPTPASTWTVGIDHHPTVRTGPREE